MHNLKEEILIILKMVYIYFLNIKHAQLVLCCCVLFRRVLFRRVLHAQSPKRERGALNVWWLLLLAQDKKNIKKMNNFVDVSSTVLPTFRMVGNTLCSCSSSRSTTPCSDKGCSRECSSTRRRARSSI
jgi:hypothetical protein